MDQLSSVFCEQRSFVQNSGVKLKRLCVVCGLGIALDGTGRLQ